MNRLMRVSFVIVLVLVLVLSIFGMAAGAASMNATEPQATMAWSLDTVPPGTGILPITVKPRVGWNT